MLLLGIFRLVHLGLSDDLANWVLFCCSLVNYCNGHNLVENNVLLLLFLIGKPVFQLKFHFNYIIAYPWQWFFYICEQLTRHNRNVLDDWSVVKYISEKCQNYYKNFWLAYFFRTLQFSVWKEIWLSFTFISFCYQKHGKFWFICKLLFWGQCYRKIWEKYAKYFKLKRYAHVANYQIIVSIAVLLLFLDIFLLF